MDGRRCAYCGRPGGAGFTVLCRMALQAGVRLKHLGHTPEERGWMAYLHPGCANVIRKRMAPSGPATTKR